MSTHVRGRISKSGGSGRKPARPVDRQEAKAASREALIKAAMELVPQKGLDVSLDELCARAGYTRGAFYQHFPDREALMAEVMRRVGAQVVDALVGGVESVARGDLLAMGKSLVTTLMSDHYPIGKDGFLRTHQLLEACTRSPKIREEYLGILQRAQERVAGAVREAQRRNLVRGDVDARALSTLTAALFIGLRTLRDLEAPVSLPTLLPTLLRLVSAGSDPKRT